MLNKNQILIKMKHWTEFLTTKTNRATQLGKMATAIEYESEELIHKYTNAAAGFQRIEKSIEENISHLYNNSEEMQEDIERAKEKAEKHNNKR